MHYSRLLMFGTVASLALLAACGPSPVAQDEAVAPEASAEAADATMPEAAPEAAPAADAAAAPAADTPSEAAAAAAPAAETAAAAPAAAAVVPASTGSGFANYTGDAAKGRVVFIQCQSCHTLEAGKNRVGPSLHDLIGREAGTVEGFRYSPANKNSHLVWSEETLFTYLENPRKMVPGTTMAYAGLKDPQKRADLIAFLKVNGQI
ncbi:c-type cytochrome [Sandaracinobacteroides sp. A072]|uniref:c-type cytochrome n=1 Tax=Sandaracinobacteroides sp. A072 TaxID=3461146 RepID=UPI004042F4D6